MTWTDSVCRAATHPGAGTDVATTRAVPTCRVSIAAVVCPSTVTRTLPAWAGWSSATTWAALPNTGDPRRPIVIVGERATCTGADLIPPAKATYGAVLRARRRSVPPWTM